MKVINFSNRTLLSYFSFNIGWWACSLSPYYGMPWLGPSIGLILVFVHLYFSPTPVGEGVFFFLLAAIGFCIDSILIYAHVFSIIPAQPAPPPWLITMWVLLGITFEGMLIMRQNILLVYLAGLLSGPLSYIFAEAVEIPSPFGPEFSVSGPVRR